MTTITAKYVNRPLKPEGKYGNIVDASGAKFFFPIGMLDAFAPGQTYEVPTAPKKWGQDVVTVIEGRPGSAGSGVVAQPNGTPAPQPTPPPRQAPAPSYNGNGNYAKDVQIATIALLKSFIEAGKIGLTDLPTAETVCLAAAKRIVEAAK